MIAVGCIPPNDLLVVNCAQLGAIRYRVLAGILV